MSIAPDVSLCGGCAGGLAAPDIPGMSGMLCASAGAAKSAVAASAAGSLNARSAPGARSTRSPFAAARRGRRARSPTRCSGRGGRATFPSPPAPARPAPPAAGSARRCNSGPPRPCGPARAPAPRCAAAGSATSVCCCAPTVPPARRLIYPYGVLGKYRVGVSVMTAETRPSEAEIDAPASVAVGPAIDPVCGMKVDPATSPHHAAHDGRDFHFCSTGCRTKFFADPGKYLNPRDDPPTSAGVIYTCPMHPEVRQIGPGACPICGMALEPATASADDGPNPELADMTRRLWVGLALTLPVFALEMGGHLFGLAMAIGGTASNWLQLGLATPVVLWAGRP